MTGPSGEGSLPSPETPGHTSLALGQPLDEVSFSLSDSTGLSLLKDSPHPVTELLKGGNSENKEP